MRFIGPIVIKTVPESPIETALLNDRDVFVPSVRRGGARVMVRGFAATTADLPTGQRLLERLWVQPDPVAPNPKWRQLLIAHLEAVYPSMRLLGRVNALPEPRRWVRIHGDATVANLIRLPGFGVRWIDPMSRPYIPGHPLVDVGKMLQSCWGYEAALWRSEPPRWNDDAAEAVMLGLSGSDRYCAETWLLVHLARLLRYHSRWLADAFRDILLHHYNCGT